MKYKDAAQQSEKESNKEPITSQKVPRPEEEKKEKQVQESSIKLPPRKSPRGKSMTKEDDIVIRKEAHFRMRNKRRSTSGQCRRTQIRRGSDSRANKGKDQ